MCNTFYNQLRLDVQSMRWLRLVGSWKLSVSFAKENSKKDDILQCVVDDHLQHILQPTTSRRTVCLVATISRVLKITCLFCKRALQKRRYSAKETNNFKEPSNRNHPIIVCNTLSNSLQTIVCRLQHLLQCVVDDHLQHTTKCVSTYSLWGGFG